MRIEICQSYEALSLKAKEIVTSELGQHKALTLCAATGGSPTRTVSYTHLTLPTT